MSVFYSGKLVLKKQLASTVAKASNGAPVLKPVLQENQGTGCPLVCFCWLCGVTARLPLGCIFRGYMYTCHASSVLYLFYFPSSVEQTDLVLEAAHLDAFNANFAAKAWDDCRFPRVLFRAEDVLVRNRAASFDPFVVLNFEGFKLLFACLSGEVVHVSAILLHHQF